MTSKTRRRRYSVKRGVVLNFNIYSARIRASTNIKPEVDARLFASSGDNCAIVLQLHGAIANEMQVDKSYRNNGMLNRHRLDSAEKRIYETP
jgi:hypothetical protein